MFALLAAGASSFGVVKPGLPVAAVRSATAPTMRMGGFGFGNLNSRGGGKSSSRSIGRFLGKGGFFWKPPGMGGDGGKGKGPSRRMSEDDDEKEPEKKDEAEGLWAKYEKALNKNPIFVKGLTSFIGFALGDLLAQFAIEKKDEYDPMRTLRLASFGFLVHGTTSHWFYGKLDARIPGTDALAVATKVFIDQVLWNPIFGVMFFSYIGLWEGSGVQGTINKIKRDLITQVTGSWTVWPLAHAINFRFIPTSQRVLYINVIQVFYNCFLSIISSKTVDLV